ncbi:hypothetical protein AOQ84DRAFT_383807 [Glonium stellatum]|uniref:Uncharacterized protein n=1 Tax=Glonium stellatum TaxID=574774 RepID=A0A8E2JL97_9PEZI|nr:hypothetical protein AOQ84DRAFT_383807 [Glonium stellatum]
MSVKGDQKPPGTDPDDADIVQARQENSRPEQALETQGKPAYNDCGWDGSAFNEEIRDRRRAGETLKITSSSSREVEERGWRYMKVLKVQSTLLEVVSEETAGFGGTEEQEVPSG